MSVNPELSSIRAKKIGVLLFDGRQAADKEVIDCARALGISTSRYRAYETGRIPPTLSELEALAYLFNIPVEHFWNPSSLLSRDAENDAKTISQYLQVRNRVIAAQLRLNRDNLHTSLKSLSEVTGIPSARIGRYERGGAAYSDHRPRIAGGSAFPSIGRHFSSVMGALDIGANPRAWWISSWNSRSKYNISS